MHKTFNTFRQRKSAWIRTGCETQVGNMIGRIRLGIARLKPPSRRGKGQLKAQCNLPLEAKTVLISHWAANQGVGRELMSSNNKQLGQRGPTRILIVDDHPLVRLS